LYVDVEGRGLRDQMGMDVPAEVRSDGSQEKIIIANWKVTNFFPCG
jgi:hypothetical protein